jgi:hypothetical protein
LARTDLRTAKVKVVINAKYQFMSNSSRRAFVFNAGASDSALANRQGHAQAARPMQEGSDPQAFALRPAQAFSVSQPTTTNEEAP